MSPEAGHGVPLPTLDETPPKVPPAGTDTGLAAWTYYESHRQEIERDIAERDEE